ncbi:unnamed protein product [Clonostachys rosea]|uniref:Uncharacterized protein n=1 Tax=Bionectria ochroleuca TaxID=29856 RepID=A0ABY6V3U1_BIOOC|nr:unnamed protein product [Clonostachys rosea]
MAGKRKQPTRPRAPRQAGRRFPRKPKSTLEDIPENTPENVPENTLENIPANTPEPKPEITLDTPSAVPMAQNPPPVSPEVERERIYAKMKENAWARAMLSTQIKHTQRDIMRTKLLGTYDKQIAFSLSEHILKLHKREREIERLEIELKELGLEEAKKTGDKIESEAK